MSGLPSPLQVLLQAMYRKWNEGDLDGAASLARVAAPYLHARLLATRPVADLRMMTDAELDGLCHDGRDAGETAPAVASGEPG